MATINCGSRQGVRKAPGCVYLTRSSVARVCAPRITGRNLALVLRLAISRMAVIYATKEGVDFAS